MGYYPSPQEDVSYFMNFINMADTSIVTEVSEKLPVSVLGILPTSCSPWLVPVNEVTTLVLR